MMTRLFNIGITASVQRTMIDKIKIANQVALVNLLFGLLFGTLSLGLNAVPWIFYSATISSLVILLLNYYHFYLASRAVVCLYPALVISAVHAMLVHAGKPPITALYIAYAAVAIVPFILFDRREKVPFVIISLIVWAVFLIQDFINYWIEVGVDDEFFRQPAMTFLMNSCNVIVITAFLIFYQKQNVTREEEQHALLTNIVENFPGVVYQGKVDGTINPHFISPGSTKLLGIAAQEIIENGIHNAGILEKKDLERLQAISKEVSQAGEFPFHYELTYPVKVQGNKKWILDKGKFRKTEKGEIWYEGIWLDITGKIEAETALKEKEQQLKFVLESSEDMITLHNEHGKYLYYNGPKCYDIKPEEIVGKTPFDFFNSDSANNLMHHLKAVFKTGKSVFFENQLDWQGSKKWFSEYIYPVKDDSGNIKCVAKICRDINNRKLNEQKIRESQEQLSLIYNHSQTMMVLIRVEDNNFILESMNNPAWLSLKSNGSKLKKSEILEKDLYNFYKKTFYHTDDMIRERLKLFRDIINSKKSFTYKGEIIMQGNKATKVNFENIVTPIFNESGSCSHILWSIQDTTERVRSAQALKSMTDQLSLIYHNTVDYIGLIRLEGEKEFIIESLNEPFWAWLKNAHPELRKQDLVGKNLENYYNTVFICTAAYVKRRKQYFKEVAEKKKSLSFDGFPKFQSGNQADEFFLSTLSPIIDNHGKVTHILAVSRNITEQKKAESLLKQSREEIQKQLQFNQLILASTFDGYILVDTEANIVDVNPAYCKLSGYSREELLRMKIADLEQSMSKEKIKQQVQYLLEHKRARLQSKHLRKDGTLLDVDNNLNLVQFEGKSMIAGFIRDITLEKQVQRALEYRLKLENLLLKTSSEFINLPLKNLEKGIEYALKQLTEFIDFDRCGIVLFNPQKNTGSIRYEWCKPGIQTLKNHYQDVPNEAHSWMINRLKKKEMLVLTSRNELPQEAKQLKSELEQVGVQSLIQVPLFWQEKLIGFMAFDAKGNRQTLPNDLDTLLRFAGEMIINVLQRKKGEQALQASEEELSLIYNNSNEFIGLLQVENEKNFYIRSFNKALIDGVKLVRPDIDVNQFIGLKMSDFYKTVLGYSDEMIRQRLADWKNVVDTKKTKTVQNTLPIPYKGRPAFVYESHHIPILGPEGNCEYLLFVAQDITEKEIAKEALVQSEKRLSSVFNSTKERMAIYGIQKDGKFVLEQVNQSFRDAWEDLTKDTKIEEYIDREHIDYLRQVLMYPEDKVVERDKLLKQVFASKKTINFEKEYYAMNNERYFLDITISPILDDDGNCKKLLFVGRDISFKKKANELLISKILETEDRERKRISKELHDSLGQNLTTASLNLNHLKNVIPQIDDSYKIKFQNGIKYLNNAINESRNIAHNLMPQSIVDFGYVLTIESLIENLNETTDIQFVFYNNLKGERLASFQELSLFRITQEAINNILKHSEASKVTLQLMRYPETILLTIEDNGKGFELESTIGNSFGLDSMKARVSSLSGSIHIDSKLEKGTSITVEIPTKENNSLNLKLVQHDQDNAG